MEGSGFIHDDTAYAQIEMVLITMKIFMK